MASFASIFRTELHLKGTNTLLIRKFTKLTAACALAFFTHTAQASVESHDSDDHEAHAEHVEDTDHGEHGEEHTEDHGHGEGGFNAGEMIMHHIADSHDWHIMDIDGHAVSMPLPVIVYHPDKGLSIFMSSKFDHGHADHNGYRLVHDKVKVVGADGNVDEEASASIIDLSITKNAFMMILACILMVWIFLSVAKAYKKRAGEAPKGLQSLLEPVIIFVRDNIAKSSIGEHKYERYMPFLLTLFFFIWIINIMGLIPIPGLGGANVTGNVAVPTVLALFVFFIVNISGNKHYWRHIFAMPGIPIPVLIILTPIEIMQIFIRPIVLIIRLFANIMAGHIVMLVFFSLIFIAGSNGESLVGGLSTAVPSIAFTVFLTFLELLVAAIQAYVFTLLASIYIGMAVVEEHH